MTILWPETSESDEADEFDVNEADETGVEVVRVIFPGDPILAFSQAELPAQLW
jgi:hypothetical protein